jgi:ferredoxin
MKIFYFTSTGNSLAVAKKIGGTLVPLVSIPQIADNFDAEYSDDVIGVVFPIYWLSVPKMVRRFLTEAKLSADYIFAIGTYGSKPGACMKNIQRHAANIGGRIDYAASLLMVDNYLPSFDVSEQIKMLPKKNTDENLRRIVADIQARRKLTAEVSSGWRLITAIMQVVKKTTMKDTQAQNYLVNESCTSCGICAQVCPSGNISVSDKVVFSDHCECCLGCVHLCPQNAIHLKQEQSAERWRNPDVSLHELIAANNRTKKA